MTDVEEPAISREDEAKPASASTANRWLILAVVFLVVAFGGLGIWFKTDADRALDEAETALAESSEALAAAEQTGIDLDEEVDRLSEDVSALDAELVATQEQLATTEDQLVGLESDVKGFISAMFQAAPMDSADAECVAELMVESQGAGPVLTGIAEAAQSPSIGSPLMRLGLALAEAAESCGVDPNAIFGDEAGIALAATQIAATGYFIDPNSTASEGVVVDAIADAGRTGGTLYIVVLAYEPLQGTVAFADAVLDQVEVGYVLTIGAESVGWAGDGSAWSQSEMDAALDASLEGFSDDEIIRLFVDHLSG